MSGTVGMKVLIAPVGSMDEEMGFYALGDGFGYTAGSVGACCQ